MTLHDSASQDDKQLELQWCLRLSAFVATGAAGLALLLWVVLWQILPRYAPELVMEYSPFVEPALKVVFHHYPYYEMYEVVDRFATIGKHSVSFTFATLGHSSSAYDLEKRLLARLIGDR